MKCIGQAPIKTALSEFNDEDRVTPLPSSQQLLVLSFTINPVCEVEHPAAIILDFISLYNFVGTLRNKKCNQTLHPVTVSSIQLMDSHHGCHYLLRNTGTTMSKYKITNMLAQHSKQEFGDLTQKQQRKVNCVTAV